MTLVMNQILDAQITKPEVKEEKTNEPEVAHETIRVLWDCAPMLGLEEEDLWRKFNFQQLMSQQEAKDQ